MTAALNIDQDRQLQAVEAVELYPEGLTVAEVAERRGRSRSVVRTDLRRASVQMRPGSPRPLYLVRDRDRQPPAPLHVPPERAAMAYTADRGWHLVQAPPAWALDLLAELD